MIGSAIENGCLATGCLYNDFAKAIKGHHFLAEPLQRA